MRLKRFIECPVPCTPENHSVTASCGSLEDKTGREGRRWKASYPVLREIRRRVACRTI
jgi:hypothetical protein